jgi:hypothetical protein
MRIQLAHSTALISAFLFHRSKDFKFINQTFMRVILLLLLFVPFISNAQWLGSGNIYYNSGNVGIGISTPLQKLHVAGGAIQSADGTFSNINARLIGTGIPGLRFTRWTGSGSNQHNAFVGQFYNSGEYSFGIGTGSSSSGDQDATSVGLTMTLAGNIGIGTTNPTQRLHLLNPSSSTYLNLDKTNGTEAGVVFSKNNNPLFYLWSDNADDDALKIEVAGLPGEVDATPRMMFPSTNKNIYMAQSGGSVGIGTTSVNDVNYRLFVETGVRTRKIKVDQSTWPDYVFHPTYKLRPLIDLESYINQNKHLPDVPSASDVEKNGLDLGDNQGTLLKKIEELTLYIIAADKKISELEQHLKKMQSLELRLQRLENK